MRTINILIASSIFAIPCLANSQTILNGDFSQGATGFTTDYTLATTQNSLQVSGPNGGAQYYGIGTDPSFFHPAWNGPALSSSAMIVNGALAANQAVWQGTLGSGSLVAGTQYEFSVDIANLYPVSPATLALSVDGISYGSQVITAGNAGNNSFVTESVLFTASSSETSPIFRLVDTNLDSGGNDFAITHLHVQSVPEPANFAVLGVGILGIVARKRRRG
jgi:hypothetical protein